MKKSLYFGILCGLCGVSAYGQSVVIVDKDGLTHKFPTENIKEITFEKSEAPQPAFVFDEVRINDWGDGNIELIMTGENSKVDLDVYGPEDAAYLMAGTYPCNNTEKPYTVNTSQAYTDIYVNDVRHDLIGGNMTIEDNDGFYTITTNFILDDGSEFVGRYEGTLSDYSSNPAEPGALELADATDCKQVDINDPAEGEFYLRLNDAYWNYEMVLDLYTTPGATVLADGVYTYSDTPGAGNFGPKSNLDDYVNNIHEYMRGGTITVSTEGDNTVIKLNGILANEREVTCTFSGKIQYLN